MDRSISSIEINPLINKSQNFYFFQTLLPLVAANNNNTTQTYTAPQQLIGNVFTLTCDFLRCRIGKENRSSVLCTDRFEWKTFVRQQRADRVVRYFQCASGHENRKLLQVKIILV